MRGNPFHKHLAEESAIELCEAGFSTTLECPVRLKDGTLNSIDILAGRGWLSLGRGEWIEVGGLHGYLIVSQTSRSKALIQWDNLSPVRVLSERLWTWSREYHRIS